MSTGTRLASRADAPRIAAVEWVTDHQEAHGQLLVHGTTLGEVISRAVAALHASTRALYPAGLHLRVIRTGWWHTTPCQCRRTLATSNHPRWHYAPAQSGEPGAWHGAEVRYHLTCPADRSSRR
ncbi:hypothetical protein [Amycolatopsis aidingensis]|uniref:hypothetical protein n=1 Tax=Amycolatopsis aidingensis TaxID=2842453 RepID=UPI001C0AD57B|nr:hypothetical protein [Amycolatopsis aidingensis]